MADPTNPQTAKRRAKGSKLGGRPTRYKPEYGDQAYRLCLLHKDTTDEDLAEFLTVAVSSIYEWKKKHPEFADAVRSGKVAADAEVANALRQRAMGYSHPEDKIFLHEGEPVVVPTIRHYPPDTAAAFIWLKNRAGWRDKHEHEHSGEVQLLPPQIR